MRALAIMKYCERAALFAARSRAAAMSVSPVSCNTAKGQNPLRLKKGYVRFQSKELVAIPRKGRTLCGSPA